jgi:AraC family transcriptional regulator of adaptative response / DNA-3-methyladenine glycosylase II
MTPGDYRRLGSSPDFSVALPADFRAGEMLAHFGRDAESPTERVGGMEMVKALRLAGTPARLHILLDDGIARCRIDADLPIAPEGMREAHGIVLRILGLGWDTSSFERQVARRPELAPLVAARPGLRIPMTADPFEAMVWVIAGQQVNLAFAYALRRAVIGLAGEDAGDGFRAHPTPEAVARLDYDDLTARKFSRRKAEYVIDTARLVASGELPLASLAGAPATRVSERLMAVRGLGRWSVQYLLMRGYGLADCVPVGDTGLTSALQRFFALESRPGPAETEALMEPFAPHRSLATFHLWSTLGDPQ